jgi:PAS domain S-box-containing protein
MLYKQHTILLVDDCPEDRETYCRYLLQYKQNAYRLLEADCGEQALLLCSQRFPDAIVLDYLLPDLNGLEVLSELKARWGRDDLPVVMITGQGNEEVAVAAIKGGASDYLIKSKTKAENLQLAVDSCVSRQRKGSQARFRTSIENEEDVSRYDFTALRQAQAALQQQLLRQRLAIAMLERIRQSLNLDEILKTTVEEVRQFLDTDRVVIFRFESDWSGDVMVESVGSEWTAILSTTLRDPCFSEPKRGASYVERYRQGRVMATTDIYTARLEPCHVELLANFQVRANLVVPILQGEFLWGLLIAHHCRAPRQWQSWEIDLLQQLAIQVGIAIRQSTLYEQLQSELSERRRAEKLLRRATDELERRVEERTAELAFANQQLQLTLEELGVAQEELLQQNDELIVAREMAESERQRYQDLFEFAPDGYLVTDVRGNIQEANRAAATLLCVRPDRMVGKPLALFIAQTDHRIFYAQLTELEQIQDWEVYLKPRKGKPFPAAISMTSAHDAQDRRVELRWLLRDIRDRKYAEQKIQEQAALIDVSTDAIFVRDLKNRILFWSQGAERLYGWRAEETLKKKANKLFYRESSSQLEAGLNLVVSKGTWHGELEQVTKDGKEIVVESRWTLVCDESGRPNSILVVNTNITEKKHLEAQFYRAQRLESLGTLASGIAHDLNNILQPILFSAQLLTRKTPNLDEQAQDKLKIISDSALRGASLVKQILSFACGADGQRTRVQVEHQLEEVVQFAQKTFPKSIKICMDIPTQDLRTVYADATQLHQVLMNLIVNARDAMPNGGTLTVCAQNFWMDERLARMYLEAQVGFYLVVAIADTGTGIPLKIRERIFDPFFTTKEPGKGTGLGLATAMGIVKNHGGFLTVESTVGKGSQFKVYLPAIEGEETRSAQEQKLPTGRGELILIVDDEAPIRKMVKTSLEEYNYRTLTANDGIEAIALYTKHKNEIDVVLMDLMMPAMDGLTAIRRLKKIDPQLKIIIASGLDLNRSLLEATKMGVQAFLSKSYSIEELLHTLDEVLRKAEGRR